MCFELILTTDIRNLVKFTRDDMMMQYFPTNKAISRFNGRLSQHVFWECIDK